MKIEYEIEEYEPEREYMLVKFTSPDNADWIYYKSLNPPDFSKEKLVELLEAVGSVVTGFWNRAKDHKRECPIPMSGEMDVEPEFYMAKEIFPVILDQPDYDVWTERIQQQDYTSPLQETIGWDIIKLTPDEQAVQAVFLEDCARLDRNELLMQTDWVHQPDAQVENMDRWNDYRQALRDVPEQPGWPKKIIWPERPEVVKEDH